MVDKENHMIKYKKLFLASLLLCGMQIFAMDRDEHAEQEIPKISFIYYPTNNPHNANNKLLSAGHAELAVDDTSYISINTTFGIQHSNRPLQGMIQKATSDGHPFFAFTFEVNERAAKKIKAAIRVENAGRTCSSGALYPLEQAGLCYVPRPLHLSPFFSAACLATGKVLGLNKVKTIECHRNPSLPKSLMKMTTGPVKELAMVGSIVCVMALDVWVMWFLLQDL